MILVAVPFFCLVFKAVLEHVRVRRVSGSFMQFSLVCEDSRKSSRSPFGILVCELWRFPYDCAKVVKFTVRVSSCDYCISLVFWSFEFLFGQ